MVKIFRVIKNWQSAQWSPLYSPAAYGDRFNENAHAWINKKKRSVDPDNAAIKSLTVAFERYTDTKEYIKLSLFFGIAFFGIWLIEWTDLSRAVRDSYYDSTALPEYALAYVLMIIFVNTVTVISIGLETTKSLLKTLLRLPAALIITTPISLIPAAFVNSLIYNGTMLLPHPQNLYFLFSHAKKGKAIFYYSLFRDEGIVDSLVSTSRTMMARPFVTHGSSMLTFAEYMPLAPVYLLCGLFTMIPLILIGLEPGPRYFEVALYIYIAMGHYTVYAMAKQFHYTHGGFLQILALREHGKEVPDISEAEAILKMNFKPDEPIDNKIAHDVLNQKLGIDSPFYLHGPIKPIEGLDDGGYWDNFYYGRVPPLKREEAGT